MPYLPSPVGIAALNAPLSVETELSFDTGNPATDRMAKLIANFANIPYDSVMTVSVDAGATERDNDISAPAVVDLIPIYKPSYAPADIQVVAILLTCEFGEAALYFATDLTTEDHFDPPNVDEQIPIPLAAGGWFLYANNHAYMIASNWQTETDVPVFIGEILAATFQPTRVTGYVFSKNRSV